MPRRVRAILAGVMVLTISAAAHAIPTLLHYQGVLTDDVGTPITTNTSVVFTLWSAPIGGVIRWQEMRSITPSAEGKFSILLGQAAPLHDSVFKMPPIYLGVQVGADPELAPRSILASGAFAFRIATIDGATGGNVTGSIEVLTDGIGSGLGVRDPGGNVSLVTPTTAVFTNSLGETTAQIGETGIQMFAPAGSKSDPQAVDTIFAFNPTTNSLRIGLDNVASGQNSISVGSGNAALGANAIAIGTANQANDNNCVALGNSNIADTLDATVTGGRNNIADAFGATVGGGLGNRSSGEGAVVAGGQSNLAEVSNSTVGGGTGNSAIHDGSTVGGGGGNTVSGVYSTIAGGEVNTAEGWWSSIAGGSQNVASGYFSTVAGGANNAATEYWSFAAGRHARAEHVGSFVWGDSYDTDVISSASDQFTARASGGVRFFTDAFLTTGASLAPGGGSWSSISDRNLKENITAASSEDILTRLAALPIAEWNYISQSDSIRHIGPMAQDFYAAFGVGEDNRHITTIDADGVALAAIQALYERNQELEATVADLKSRLERLEAR